MSTNDSSASIAEPAPIVTPEAEAEIIISTPEAAPAEELGPDEPAAPPMDAAADVSLGDTVTVTIPRAAAEVLANPDGRKLAELGDASAILRVALGE